MNDLMNLSGNKNSSIGNDTKTSPLSSLTMRFMPLIECYLTVCRCTLLAPPALAKPVDVESSTKKRDREETRQSTSESTKLDSSSQLALSPLQLIRSDSIIGVALQSAVKPESLPGFRFRQHEAFMLMQLGLKDGEASRRFKSFIEKNSVLLNMILRQNVHLFETSFSALVLVPFCRHRLHFDIKRIYFKNKLKKMKQSSARMQGSLRVHVNRKRVLEESFRKLRYTSAEEMRRRLSITFSGEEGLSLALIYTYIVPCLCFPRFFSHYPSPPPHPSFKVWMLVG